MLTQRNMVSSRGEDRPASVREENSSGSTRASAWRELLGSKGNVRTAEPQLSFFRSPRCRATGREQSLRLRRCRPKRPTVNSASPPAATAGREERRRCSSSTVIRWDGRTVTTDIRSRMRCRLRLLVPIDQRSPERVCVRSVVAVRNRRSLVRTVTTLIRQPSLSRRSYV